MEDSDVPPILELPSEWNWERIVREENEETKTTLMLPKEINIQIRSFKGAVGVFKKSPNQTNLTALENRDVSISSAIQDFIEKDLPEEPEQPEEPIVEETIINPPTMSPELLARAQAVGLTETATEAEIIAAENEKNNPPPPPPADPPALTAEQEALIARAKAVGLPETATEAEIVAAETEKNNPPPPPPVKKMKKSGIGQYFPGLDEEE